MSTPTVPPVDDRLVEVEGRHLRVRTSGRLDDAPPILLLHGIMGHAREWDALVRTVSHEVAVIALDQRGHGRSDWADTYTLAAMTADAGAVLDALDVPRAHVVGHSLGGMVALALAAARPTLVDRLVVVDVGPDSIAPPEVRAGLVTTLEHLAAASYATVQEAVDEWLAGDPFAREDLLAHYVGHALQPRSDGRLVWRFDAAGLVEFPRTTTPAALWAAVDRLTAPTLLVRGGQSPFLSSEHAGEVGDRLGDGHLVTIPDAAHDLGVQRPEAVAAAVLEFLAPVPVSA